MRIKYNVIIQKEENWYVAKCIDNNVASSIGQFVLQNPVCPTRGRGTSATNTASVLTQDSVEVKSNVKSK